MNPNTPTPTPPKSQDSPWYKNPILMIFVIGLPVFVVVACIFFIIFAINIQDSTVRDDWYMDGKALYQDASKDQLANDLGVRAVMYFEGETGQNIRLELNYPAEALQAGKFFDGGAITYPKELAVVISHATDKTRDRDFVLTHQVGNIYTGMANLDLTVPSRYYVQISPSDDYDKKWRLLQKTKLPAKAVGLNPLKAFEQEQGK